jgi:hypothetical protein
LFSLFTIGGKKNFNSGDKAKFGDGEELVKLYHPTATLLPTLSDEVGHAQTFIHCPTT